MRNADFGFRNGGNNVRSVDVIHGVNRMGPMGPRGPMGLMEMAGRGPGRESLVGQEGFYGDGGEVLAA